MFRVSLLMLGAFAAMVFAMFVLVALPDLMLDPLKPPRQLPPYTAAQLAGRAVYQADGCLYCHSQQVRDSAITDDEKRGWGRPSVPEDYYYDFPQFMGTSRTGPDLMNVGDRLPDRRWQLLHLYEPRALVAWSVMPAFKFMFQLKDRADPGDEVVAVPASYSVPGKVVVARPEAARLVDYLLGLKHDYPVPAPQVPLP